MKNVVFNSYSVYTNLKPIKPNETNKEMRNKPKLIFLQFFMVQQSFLTEHLNEIKNYSIFHYFIFSVDTQRSGWVNYKHYLNLMLNVLLDGCP